MSLNPMRKGSFVAQSGKDPSSWKIRCKIKFNKATTDLGLHLTARRTVNKSMFRGRALGEGEKKRIELEGKARKVVDRRLLPTLSKRNEGFRHSRFVGGP